MSDFLGWIDSGGDLPDISLAKFLQHISAADHQNVLVPLADLQAEGFNTTPPPGYLFSRIIKPADIEPL